MKKEKISHLETALQLYLDIWRLYRFTHRAALGLGLPAPWTAHNAHEHSNELPGYLMQLRNSIAGVERFDPPIDFPLVQETLFGHWMPRGLALWNSSSRQVYGPTAELQAVLEATSLSETTWDDFLPPFASYGIKLGRPLTNAEGKKYDFMLICIMPGNVNGKDERLFNLWLFPETYPNAPHVALEQSQRIQTLLKSRRWDAALAKIQKVQDAVTAQSKDGVHSWWTMRAGEKIVDAIGDLKDESRAYSYVSSTQLDLTKLAYRIAIGLTLYIQSRPTRPVKSKEDAGTTEERAEPSPRTTSVDRSAIVTADDIALVDYHKSLSYEEKLFLGLVGTPEEQRRAQIELSCHWRRGHWRRPPNTEATATKVVQVSPALVRQDRLADGSQPSGRFSEVE
jgi:hypothetical protein